MSQPPAETRVVVRRPMNDHDTVTVEVCATNETRHLVEYASPELRRTLSDLPAGAAVPLGMSRVGVRSNVWRVISASGADRAPVREADDARDGPHQSRTRVTDRGTPSVSASRSR
jgi:hypothetical protein